VRPGSELGFVGGATSFSEKVVHERGLWQIAVEQMHVSVKRERRGVVAQHLLHLLRVPAVPEEVGRTGVSERVPSGPGDASAPGSGL
jgi:hypothetical protein